MKGLKRILLGIAFLLVAVIGVLLGNSEIGALLFIGGSVIGLLLCIFGFFDEAISKLFAKIKKLYSENEEETK